MTDNHRLRAEWYHKTTSELHHHDDIGIHERAFETNFANWSAVQGPPPAWVSMPDDTNSSNIAQVLSDLNFNTYEELHRWSLESSEQFWTFMVDRLGITFSKRPDSMLLDARPPHFFVGSMLNIVDSCKLQASTPAIIYDDDSKGLTTLSRAWLRQRMGQVAGGLSKLGVQKGDSIALMLPLTPDSIATYLAVIAMGCVVVSIADSFAVPEVQTRLEIAQCTRLVTYGTTKRGSKQLPQYERLKCLDIDIIVLSRDSDPDWETRDRDCMMNDLIEKDGTIVPVACSAIDTINVLFSSGTTGTPKAIPWDHTTPLKCMADGFLYQDIRPGDIVSWSTNLGWMMGPWLIFATLGNGATIAISEAPPASLAFCRFVQEARVTTLGVIPTLVRSWKTHDILKSVDWTNLKLITTTGECSNPADMFYLMARVGYRPIIEYCGGTELAGGYMSSTLLHDSIPSTFACPTVGFDLVIPDDPIGEAFLQGNSPGQSTTLLNRDHDDIYYDDVPTGSDGTRLRRHGDVLERLPNGYYRALGRVDDTMNLSGIKVSAAEIERIVNRVSGIRESAAIAESEDGGPLSLAVFVVLDQSTTDASTLHESMQQALREQLNPQFKISRVQVLDALPKTASNKIMRRTLRSQ